MEQCKYLCEFEAIGPLDGISAYSSTDALTNSAAGSADSSKSAADSHIISPLELRNREIKRQTLLELIELVNSTHRPIPDQLYPNFFEMVKKIFTIYYNDKLLFILICSYIYKYQDICKYI